MTALVRSELLKLRTTRAWIWFLVVLLALVGLGTSANVGGATEQQFADPGFSRDVLDSSLVAGVVAFLLGILSVTAEWRHGTLTRTFLVTPRRERVLVAKVVTSLVVGAIAAALAVGLALAVAVPWFSAEGVSYELDGVPGLIGRIVLAAVLWGAFGVGVGALIRNQTGAVVAGILWILVVENLLALLFGVLDADSVDEFLPGRALGALEGSVDDGLSAWGGAGVAVAWILALNAIGAQRVARADLT